MKKLLKLVILLFTCTICRAQQHGTADSIYKSNFFSRRSVVLFDDNFDHSILNAFPALWEISPCNGAAYKNDQYCHIRQTGNGTVMVILPNDEAIHGNIIDNLIFPVLPIRGAGKDYLPDSFTLDYSFLMGSVRAEPVLHFGYYDDCFLLPVILSGNDGHRCALEINIPGNADSGVNGREKTISILAADSFRYDDWHHFALSYYYGSIAIYLDHNIIYNVADCHCNPMRMCLSAMGGDSVFYRQVKIRIGSWEDHDGFDALLTGDKIITHAIHFDVNSYAIRAESRGVIAQLASWLRENPQVKIEIDGHTDTDGDPAANIRLSQARADEVTRQLVSLGIQPGRITAKGYGATKPLCTDASDECKARNRRVELIKVK